MLRAAFLLSCTCILAAAAPLPMVQGPLAALVEDAPAATTVSGHSTGTQEPPAAGKGVETLSASPPLAMLRIDWLNNTPPPEDFSVEVAEARKTISSTHRLGKTSITRTILATPDAIFLHFVADHPGAISFKVSLSSPKEGKISTQGRTGLLWSGAGDSTPRAYARVIPFESDVEQDGDSIILRGEGECMVIFSFTPTDDPGKPLAGIWERLAETLDPGQDHADPVKIWQTISAGRAAP